MSTTTTTTLAAWRAARTSRETLPSGLPATLRKVHLLDLAAQGQIPAPLVGQVEQLMQAAERGPQGMQVADFPQHAAVIDLVVRAALVDPPIADEPDEDHISLAELPFSDRIHIFNWAQGEAAQVATFPEPAGAGPRTPRGRPRVRAATESAAAGQLGGLADRPGSAGPGDAGRLPYTGPDGREIGRGIAGADDV